LHVLHGLHVILHLSRAGTTDEPGRLTSRAGPLVAMKTRNNTVQ